MEREVTDSTLILATDTVRDTLRQTDFLIGNLIPVAPGETVFPIEMMTTDTNLNVVYTPHKRDPGQPVPNELLNTDFSFGVLSFSLILLALLSVYARKSVTSGLAFLSFRRQPELPAPSTLGILSWPPLFKNIFTLLNISLFATISIVLTGIMPPMPGFATVKTTALIFTVFLVALLLRHLTCIIIAVFTGQKNLFREYMAVIYNAWFVSALIAFTMSAIILFTTLKKTGFLIPGCAALIILLLFLRIIRLLNIFIKRHVSILYFILYLCALEVLPVLIVIKILGVF